MAWACRQYQYAWHRQADCCGPLAEKREQDGREEGFTGQQIQTDTEGSLTNAASLGRADISQHKAPAVVSLNAFLVASFTTRVVGAPFLAVAGGFVAGQVEALS